MKVSEALAAGRFAVVVEFTPHSTADVERVAEIAKDLVGLNEKYASHGLAFTAISLTQNPGGNRSYDHLAAISILRRAGFPEDLDIVPHVTGKDMNRDAIRTLLIALQDAGIGTILALTGDAPVESKGVFEVDSLGVLQIVRELNVQRLRRARSREEFETMPLLSAGAAISPYKYTEGSLAMQYIKATKKHREGAAFLICQAGWDPDRTESLIRTFAPPDAEERVPIFGNAIVVNHVAARFMQDLPGCVVTDEFVSRLQQESPADHLRRAGIQTAMFRQLGFAGVDLSKPGDFRSASEIEAILDVAIQTSDWREHRADITFRPGPGPSPTVRETAALSRAVHRLFMDRTSPLFPVVRTTLKPFDRSAEKGGLLYRVFRAAESGVKELMYECEHCGDCYLPENFYICTLGGCAKGLPNPPCGDADPRGYCGNDPVRVCAGERLYARLRRYGALEEFRDIVFPPRDPALRNTASILNYYFERDHARMKRPLDESGLIQVGELLHATIPSSGEAMRFMQNMGPHAFETPNRGLDVVRTVIEEQAQQGAHFIDINIDELRDADPPGLMRRYVQLVHKYGNGVPPCIDSSAPEVLVAGLDEWFRTGPADVPPMANSIPFSEMDKYGAVFDLRHRRPFNVVLLLVGGEGPLGSSDEMVEAARVMFQRAVSAGFSPDELFFDTVTLGIATDGCIAPDGALKPSHTHNSFHAIQRIRQDPEMRGVHAILGVSNWVYGARKRRIGHVRAFIEVARRYGLDAAICDVSKQFGLKPAAPELVEFVEMFVSLDGSDDSMMRYMDVMQKMREKEWV